MRKKLMLIFACISVTALLLTGCKNEKTSEKSNIETNNVSDTKNVDSVDKKTVFVTPEWVKSVIDGNQPESKNYVVVETYWGTEKESPDYSKGHIPGTIHVDTAIVEGEPYWNIVSAEDMEAGLLKNGITKDITVILYGGDVSGTGRVAYAWLWAGVENVKILNGGIDGWNNAGYNTEKTSNKAKTVDSFGTEVPAHPEYWLSIDDVKDKLKNDDNFKLVSVRSKDEWLGKTSGYSYIDKAGEPEGAVLGPAGSDPYHMEDYLNDDGTYIKSEEMFELWKDYDFTKDNELSFYCGTGWRATIPFLLSYQAGLEKISLYDGGWYQWQMDDDNPVQVGDPSSSDVEYTTVGKLPTDKAAK